MKKCPYCAEEIQDEAIVCKHCSRDLRMEARSVSNQSPIRQPQTQSKSKKYFWVYVIAVVIIGISIICCGYSLIVNGYEQKIINVPGTGVITGHSVTYIIEGTVPVAMVTYFNENGSMEQKDTNLPFKYEFNTDTNPMLSLVAQNKSDGGSISCKILIDGQVKKQATSTGAYVVVTCADVAF